MVVLFPGEFAEEIRCEHVTAFLSEKRPYQALSYVWGSQRVLRPIMLNDEQHHVTINLHSALKHLRHESEPRLLWVDALCINQADDSERAQQVSIMGDIYKSAAGVQIYLGDRIDEKKDSCTPPRIEFWNDSRDDTYIDIFRTRNLHHRSMNRELRARYGYIFDVFCLIRLLAQNKHVDDLPIGDKEDASAAKRALRLIEGLRRVMHNPWTPWWSRIWVVQEIVVATQVTVLYGRVSAPWTMLTQAASNYANHIQSCCSSKIKSIPRDITKVLADFSQRIQDIDEFRAQNFQHSTRNDGTANQLEPLHQVPDNVTRSSEGKPPLLSLLRKFRSRNATDPRDKVYALLGLSKTSIVPNYESSTSRVYAETVKDSIKTNNSLSVLAVDQGRKFRGDLPSWVPDWEAPEDYTQQFWADALDLYNCSTEEVDSLNIRVGECTLLLAAGHIDAIDTLGDTMIADDSEVMLKVLRQWLSIFENIVMRQGVNDLPIMLRASFRLFCADVIFCGTDGREPGRVRRIRDEDDAKFALWALYSETSPFRTTQFGSYKQALLENTTPLNGFVPILDPTNYLDSLMLIENSIRSATMNRRLFTTTSNDIGIGPAELHTGDRILQVKGSRCPFVFRVDDESQRNRWTSDSKNYFPKFCKEFIRSIDHSLRYPTPWDFSMYLRCLAMDINSIESIHYRKLSRDFKSNLLQRLNNVELTFDVIVEVHHTSISRREWFISKLENLYSAIEGFYDENISDYAEESTKDTVKLLLHTINTATRLLAQWSLVGACYLHGYMDRQKAGGKWERIHVV